MDSAGRRYQLQPVLLLPEEQRGAREESVCAAILRFQSQVGGINCSLSFFSLKNREVHVKRAHAPPSDSSHRYEVSTAASSSSA
jgi:hypothetical protein